MNCRYQFDDDTVRCGAGEDHEEFEMIQLQHGSYAKVKVFRDQEPSL